MADRRRRSSLGNAPSPGTGRRGVGPPALAPLVAAVGAAALTLALGASALWPPAPLFLWNASPSSPIGLYLVDPRPRPRLGDMVVAWAPPAARRLAAARHYLPARVPLVKEVAAVPGARVCETRRVLLVNERAAAVARTRDRSGRPLPRWSGCRRLRPGELLLLSPGSPDAFDGRYFGPTASSDVIGRARLLWRR